MNKQLQELIPSAILTAYSGKAHKCRCGCKGKYYVIPENRAIAEKDRGYSYEDKAVKPAQVTKILRMIQANEEHVKAEDNWVSIDLGDKTFTVNLIPDVQFSKPDGTVVS